MKIITDAVERSGNAPETVVLVDRRPETIEAIRSGDIVVAAVLHPELSQQPTLILRQFVAPSLLTTNRDGTNISIDMETGHFHLTLWGVLAKDAVEN